MGSTSLFTVLLPRFPVKRDHIGLVFWSCVLRLYIYQDSVKFIKVIFVMLYKELYSTPLQKNYGNKKDLILKINFLCLIRIIF
jgi:hypothetical protein